MELFLNFENPKNLDLLRQEKDEVEYKIEDLKEDLKYFQDMDNIKEEFDPRMGTKILNVLMKRELENLQNDLKDARAKLQKIDLAIGKAERKVYLRIFSIINFQFKMILRLHLKYYS